MIRWLSTADFTITTVWFGRQILMSCDDLGRKKVENTKISVKHKTDKKQ